MFVGHWYYLLILLAIVLVVFGPGRLGDLGGALGKTIREFKDSASDKEDTTVSKS